VKNAPDLAVPAAVRLLGDGERPELAQHDDDPVVSRRGRWPDAQIGEIATRQRSLITRSQLYELGLSRAAIDHSLSRGRLRALHRGVYAVGHLALPEWALELAAVLAIGDRAYLSHASAASLWGLAPAVRDAVHVTLVGRDAGRRRPGIAVHQAGALAAGDVTVRDGIPVTTAARTVLDIAPGLSDRQLERTFDAGLKERVFTRAAVAAVLDRAGLRHPGAGRLRRLVSAELRTSTITRSRAEERMLELVRAGGLTMPEVNVALGPYEVDFLWREARLVVEVDG
jgi:hypothetical protein